MSKKAKNKTGEAGHPSAPAARREPSAIRRADPCFEREAASYEYPLPSREYVEQILAERGVPLEITDRRAFARAVTTGSAVTEFEAEGKAAEEIRALWAWIKGTLERK